MSILSRAKKAIGASDTKKKSPTKGAETSSAKEKQGDSVSVPEAISINAILTEKSLLAQESDTMVFRVKPHVTKHQIAEAVVAHGAKPLSIRTVQMRPKTRRRGRHFGFTNAWKKAYVKVNDISKFSSDDE